MSTSGDDYWGDVSDYGNDYNSSDLVEIEEELYLVQGEINDPLTMFRPINELLECERDNVQLMMGELE